MPDIQFLLERYREQPKFYQDFLVSDYVSEAAMLFGNNLGFTEEQVDVFSDGIILMLLFIYNQADLEEYLQLNTNAAAADIHTMVTLLCDALPDYRKDSRAYDQARTAVSLNGNLTNEPLATEIAETEKALLALPNIRTMADDMQASPNPPTAAAVLPEEQVHSSSQADIFPNGNTMPTPRWESES